MNRIYWDTNCFLHYLQGSEEGAGLLGVVQQMEIGNLEIVTSTATIIEVLKIHDGSPQEREEIIEVFNNETGILFVDVTRHLAEKARDLIWKYGYERRQIDAIHLATAIYVHGFKPLKEIHSFDKDLLRLNGSEDVPIPMRKDFNSKEGFFHVDKGLLSVHGQTVEWFTKTPHSVRTVYLPTFATQRLKEIWTAGPIAPDGEDRMSPDKLARLYRAHCNKEGLPFVPPRNLRHSYVGLALMSGAPMWWVQSQLGHSGASSTLEAHYLWTDKTLGKKYARLLDKLIPQ